MIHPVVQLQLFGDFDGTLGAALDHHFRQMRGCVVHHGFHIHHHIRRHFCHAAHPLRAGAILLQHIAGLLHDIGVFRALLLQKVAHGIIIGHIQQIADAFLAHLRILMNKIQQLLPVGQGICHAAPLLWG